jgi:hypothetical protein
LIKDNTNPDGSRAEAKQAETAVKVAIQLERSTLKRHWLGSRQLERALFLSSFTVMLVEDFFTEAEGAGSGLNIFVRGDVFEGTLEAQYHRGI